MTSPNKLFSILSLFVLLSCGGSSDNPESTPTPPTPTVTAPVVVSTTPANNATDVAIGDVSIQITYDKDVRLDKSKTPIISGANLKGDASVNGKVLTVPVNCSDYETKVTLTIPEGMIYITGAKAAAYTLSFTTAKKPESPSANISASPVVASTEAAKKLYTYFKDQYGKKIISSVMADVNWNNKIAEKVNALTGKYPAMNCYDFIHIYVPQNNWIDYTDIKPVKEWADAGGIVQLMWHFNVPLSETTEVKSNGEGVSCSPDKTTFRAKNVFSEGSWENKWFYSEMDKVVSIILKLQDAGIAATWRPFHEAAGNATAKQQADWTKAWFWWGYDGAETCKKLWITMFDYFKQKGVKNLIWIWTTQNYNGNSSGYNQDTD